MRRRTMEEPELNLAALIDIFSIMLFFLMTTVTFLTLRTLNAAVPAISKGAVSTTDGVNVSVEIKADGYVLKATGTPEGRSERVNVDEQIARDQGRLDRKKLTELLWQIKKKAPETKNIMIFPEDGIPFQEVVLTMDASREMPSIVNPKKRVSLFTRPVLSELNK